MKKKVLNIFVFLSIFILMFSSISYATTNFIPSGDDVKPSLGGIDDESKIQEMVRNIIGTMAWIGYAIAIGMIAFIGIKYMLASADEKASLKGTLVKVVVGSVIIVLSVSIVNFVIALVTT